MTDLSGSQRNIQTYTQTDRGPQVPAWHGTACTAACLVPLQQTGACTATFLMTLQQTDAGTDSQGQGQGQGKTQSLDA